MFANSSFLSRSAFLLGVVLLFSGFQSAVAQRGQGQYGRSAEQGQSAESEENTQRASQVQPRAQENEPFIHGVSVGAGLSIYQGDYSLNPNHNLVKYIAGNGKLSVHAGVDHRLGQFDQYGLGADLVYNRISGKSTGGVGFRANTLALDFYADYELPYIKEGLFRVFIGGGPNLIISPSYFGGTPGIRSEDAYQPLGTRVIGSLKVGVTVVDALRIGTRIASTDLLDGYKGFDPNGIPDFVSFLSINYRFSVK